VIIDASTTIDLARKFGVDYRIGEDETPYNDTNGSTPPIPSRSNSYETAPQALASLLTFDCRKGAPSIAETAKEATNGVYDGASYDPTRMASVVDVRGFGNCWSKAVAALPNGKHELNEHGSDWRNALDAFDWVLHPEMRGEIRARVQAYGIDYLRYLQENGYPDLNLLTVNRRPYFRGEVMIANGLDRLTGNAVGTRMEQPVCCSYYTSYDRHEFSGSVNSESAAMVWVPWRIMMPAEFDWLLVPEGACCDSAAYNSAFRTEPCRMNYGGAAGVTAAIAIGEAMPPRQVEYEKVRDALVSLGYRFTY
jgi:hypothetical protein